MTTKPEDLVAQALKQFADKHGPIATEEKVDTLVMEKKPVKVGVGQKLFSALFGTAPKSGDLAVSVFTPDDLHPKMREFVPAINPDYVPQIEELSTYADAVENGEKVLLTGPTGAGKSTMVQHFCAVTGRPFIRVNMKRDMESSALFGMLTAHGGATHWNDGPVTEAVRYGATLLIDEWELMPSEIGMGMQNLLEENGFLYLAEAPGSSSDKIIRPAKLTNFVYAGNTVGQGDDTGRHVGAGVQNTATIDRFTTTIHLDYLSEAHEIAILTGKTGVKKEQAKKMIQLAKLVRSAATGDTINLTMSPRTLISWAQKWERLGDCRLAFNRSFFDKLRSDDKKVVNEFYVKVFG